MYRNIVIGYDGTDHARDAATLALALAKSTGAHVNFVNAFYDVPAVLPADPLRDQLRVDAKRTVEEAAHRVPADVSVAKTVITDRSPSRALYEFAEDSGADLIVLGSSGQTPHGTARAGRTASQVLDAAPCAVAIAPAGYRERGEVELSLIGVGFDGRPESEGALLAAAAIAEAAGGRLHVTAVVEPVESTLTGPIMRDAQAAIHESLAVAAREALDRSGTLVPDSVEVERSLLKGRVVETLGGEAASCGVDLLVIGSRGFGPIRRVLLGSVSHELIQGAPCPLIVVPRSTGQTDRTPEAQAETLEAR
jgi:nucleotide-binding universal stress UspA family protein